MKLTGNRSLAQCSPSRRKALRRHGDVEGCVRDWESRSCPRLGSPPLCSVWPALLLWRKIRAVRPNPEDRHRPPRDPRNARNLNDRVRVPRQGRQHRRRLQDQLQLRHRGPLLLRFNDRLPLRSRNQRRLPPKSRTPHRPSISRRVRQALRGRRLRLRKQPPFDRMNAHARP